ncbi:hypothetical protein [Streptosporangium sp. NPDC051022]|uniref:hypothetical protein n=1 Tax=Streptosporangium sp. NPDC051022 TaxID=3155752 RepID=UPI003438EF67
MTVTTGRAGVVDERPRQVWPPQEPGHDGDRRARQPGESDRNDGREAHGAPTEGTARKGRRRAAPYGQPSYGKTIPHAAPFPDAPASGEPSSSGPGGPGGPGEQSPPAEDTGSREEAEAETGGNAMAGEEAEPDGLLRPWRPGAPARGGSGERPERPARGDGPERTARGDGPGRPEESGDDGDRLVWAPRESPGDGPRPWPPERHARRGQHGASPWGTTGREEREREAAPEAERGEGTPWTFSAAPAGDPGGSGGSVAGFRAWAAGGDGPHGRSSTDAESADDTGPHEPMSDGRSSTGAGSADDAGSHEPMSEQGSEDAAHATDLRSRTPGDEDGGGRSGWVSEESTDDEPQGWTSEEFRGDENRRPWAIWSRGREGRRRTRAVRKVRQDEQIWPEESVWEVHKPWPLNDESTQDELPPSARWYGAPAAPPPRRAAVRLRTLLFGAVAAVVGLGIGFTVAIVVAGLLLRDLPSRPVSDSRPARVSDPVAGVGYPLPAGWRTGAVPPVTGFTSVAGGAAVTVLTRPADPVSDMRGTTAELADLYGRLLLHGDEIKVVDDRAITVGGRKGRSRSLRAEYRDVVNRPAYLRLALLTGSGGRPVVVVGVAQPDDPQLRAAIDTVISGIR